MTIEKPAIVASGLMAAAVTMLLAVGWPHSRQVPSENSDAPNFVVVELFTSEGCSSCPPADALLSDLISEAREDNRRLFALSFHVDSWDYLGWKDPYSDAAFSERQRQYARTFRSSRIYTPQMIVNGRYEFVGSNRTKAQRHIRSELSRESDVQIVLSSLTTAADQRVTVQYEVRMAPSAAVLNIALVESGLVNQIRRGENTGRTLRHDNVVRVFESIELKSKSSGATTLNPPDEVELDNSAIIAYVQDSRSLEILAAESLSLSSE